GRVRAGRRLASTALLPPRGYARSPIRWSPGLAGYRDAALSRRMRGDDDAAAAGPDRGHHHGFGVLADLVDVAVADTAWAGRDRGISRLYRPAGDRSAAAGGLARVAHDHRAYRCSWRRAAGHRSGRRYRVVRVCFTPGCRYLCRRVVAAAHCRG